MGPPDRQQSFPVYDSFVQPGYRLMPGQKYFYQCNWLQIMENAMDPAHTAFLHTIVSGSQFTEEFGVLPELEFVETPVGMMYIGTRRVGQNVWARMVEAVLPNLQQVAPVWETGHQEHAFSGPMVSRWIVPIDDTNTMLIELRRISETEGVTPAWWADRTGMVPGQLTTDSYEAGQRQPGDYEAQVSQRPIAVHALEHIGATDRGVMMFRNQTRRGIRAVQAGGDPTGLCRDAGAIIPTYCNDTVMCIPPDGDPAMDRRLVREAGRRLADGYLKAPPLLASTAIA
jgi:phenylpropionate dioxygenase-like ring-hydroxylating dioxygenase large terminal subunit